MGASGRSCRDVQPFAVQCGVQPELVLLALTGPRWPAGLRGVGAALSAEGGLTRKSERQAEVAPFFVTFWGIGLF